MKKIKKSFYNNLYIVIVLLSALGIIFFKFPNIPQKVSLDELEFARLALSLQDNPVIYSPLATGHTTPYYFIILFFFKLFGVSVFSFRLTAALFGVFNCLLIYVLLKEFFKKQYVAFLGALTFVFMRWAFQFSRFGFEVSYLLFWELSALYFAHLFIFTYKKKYFIFTLLASIMAFYSYLPGRIFFVLPLTYMLFSSIKKKYLYIGIFIVVLALSATPLINIFSRLEDRVGSLNYVNSKKLSYQQKLNLFGENVYTSATMLFLKGDLNGRHNFPGKAAINPILFIFFVSGLTLAAITRNKKPLIFFIWLLVALFPSLLTYPSENPHFLRTYSTTVPLVYFIALAFDHIIKLKIRYITACLVLIIVISIFYELRTYFYYQAQVFPSSFEFSFDMLPKAMQLKDINELFAPK